jgi:hypothetical protein
MCLRLDTSDREMEWWEHLGASPKTLLHVFPQSIETIFLEMDKNLFQEHSYLWAYFQKGENFLKYWCKIGVFGSSALAAQDEHTAKWYHACYGELNATDALFKPDEAKQLWKSARREECAATWWTVPLDDLLRHRTGRWQVPTINIGRAMTHPP